MTQLVHDDVFQCFGRRQCEREIQGHAIATVQAAPQAFQWLDAQAGRGQVQLGRVARKPARYVATNLRLQERMQQRTRRAETLFVMRFRQRKHELVIDEFDARIHTLAPDQLSRLAAQRNQRRCTRQQRRRAVVIQMQLVELAFQPLAVLTQKSENLRRMRAFRISQMGAARSHGETQPSRARVRRTAHLDRAAAGRG